MRLIFGKKTKTYSDEEIVHGFRIADQWVLLFVYDNFFPTTEKYIQNNGGSSEDARDVFQDAMKVVFERISNEEFKLTSSFHTFLFSICRHLWLRELRNKKLTRGQFLEIEVDVPGEENDALELEVLKIRQNALYRKHYDSLEEGCKELLMMYLHNISFKEIAEKLGFSDEMQAIHRKSKCKNLLTKRITNDPEYKDLV